MTSFRPVSRLLDELAEWTDALVALGWTSLGPAERSAGERLASELAKAGLSQCARAMQKVLDAAIVDDTESDTMTDAAGRLCIVVELARQAWELERLAGGADADECQSSDG